MKNMKIGLIDADLLDRGTRQPNLALMKISGFYKQNNEVTLLESYDDIDKYDKVFISKVFTFTKTPDLSIYENIEIGGTGFFGINAKNLPDEIEHCMPDYHLYDDFIDNEIKRGVNPKKYSNYKNSSIGFLTRGCFRKCSFCVNKKYDRAEFHAHVDEFLDESRKYIHLLDDNFLAYPGWRELLEELKKTNKYFQFRQGLDIRLITEEKAKYLSTMKYYSDWIFAFDNIKDRDLIESKLKIWRKYCSKSTKLYVLTAFESQDEIDIANTFERIKILMKYRCLPYVMRYNSFEDSYYRGMYINLARWCNQPNLYKKMSFREFCESAGKHLSTYKYMKEFEKKHPDIAAKYFDIKFEDLVEY